jgi:hypothetical protein
MNVETLMRQALPLLWAKNLNAQGQTVDAIIDEDKVTEDRLTLEVTDHVPDGIKDANPNKGVGTEPGSFTIFVYPGPTGAAVKMGTPPLFAINETTVVDMGLDTPEKLLEHIVNQLAG